jgi:hypothetical protein
MSGEDSATLDTVQGKRACSGAADAGCGAGRDCPSTANCCRSHHKAAWATAVRCSKQGADDARAAQ